MIRINLAPADELENPLWYVPDAVTAVFFLVACWFGVQSYLDSIQTRIDTFKAEEANFRANSDRLRPELERYESLEAQIAELKGRIEALNRITVSKISRYKPVIVLEHFQNLKPDGVWFRSLEFASGQEQVRLTGSGLDILTIADFLSALLSTQSQVFDPGDLRSQVYFSDLSLVSLGPSDAQSLTRYYEQFPSFEMRVTYKERSGAETQQQRLSYQQSVQQLLKPLVETSQWARVKERVNARVNRRLKSSPQQR